MCGIVGVISGYSNGFTQVEANAFQDMLFIDTLRGWDSTGVFGGDGWGNIQIHKAALHGADFVCTKEFDTWKDELVRRGLFAVGHNRAATKGVVKDENAHPFCVDDKIILCQNGTYIGDHSHHKKTEVDTEAVAHVLSENEDIATALQKINAAYALVWFNTATESLYIIRNTQRPMWIAETTVGGWMFASEPQTILYSASHSNVSLKNAPEQLEPGMLHTFKITNSKMVLTKQKIDCSFRGSSGASDWYGEDCGYSYGKHLKKKYNVHTPTTPVLLMGNDACRSHVDIHIERILLNHAQRFMFTDETLADSTYRDAQKYQATAGTVAKQLVEFVDYAPANEHKACDMWHLYGVFVNIPGDETTDNDPQVVARTLIKGKNEQEILSMCNKFYTANMGTIIKAKAGEKVMLTCFVSNLTEIAESEFV